VKDPKTNPPPKPDPKGTADSSNRRRLGRVVHDERGWASLEWHDAPDNNPQRTVLELEDTARAQTRLKALREQGAGLKLSSDDTFNPYGRKPEERSPTRPTEGGARRDLRKLSKWIKLTRELEERKAIEKLVAAKLVEDDKPNE
jgi:hypothetical protein